MKNRNLILPIFCAVISSLATSLPPLLSAADPGVPDSTSSAPPAEAAPKKAANGSPLATTAKPTVVYTAVKGDSWTSLAQKFKTTRKKLKALNNLTSNTVRPGQVLLVPALKSAGSVASTAAKAKIHHAYAMAQPVQDFDIPASTFGSCPTPPAEEEVDSSAPGVAGKPAPIAQLVSPSDLATEEQSESVAPPSVTPIPTAPVLANKSSSRKSHTIRLADAGSSSPLNPAVTPATNRFNPGIFLNPQSATPADDWSARFFQEARSLGDRGIEYDEDWRPPGEAHSWTMDCSNTTRYIYKVTAGIQLPRTASDQYYYLHLQGKAWDVPLGADGWADGNFLRRNLKPGDLLFWENTYRPERQPPITHVMVFLGTNDRGQWVMAGSQTSRGGEHNRRNGGPDIYVFRPSQPCGGYTTWMGLVHHQGRFCAFGRPLEADAAKLAVAAND